MELKNELLQIEELETRLEMETTDGDGSSCTITSTCTIEV
jgi:hypothetical protein